MFGIPAERLDVLVHPQSIVHGLVSFADGSVIAGLAMPDMKVPIAHCLGYPGRVSTAVAAARSGCDRHADLRAARLRAFPGAAGRHGALASGRGLPTVLNAANEIAVEAFLDRRIGFSDIAGIVEAACDAARADGHGRRARRRWRGAGH